MQIFDRLAGLTGSLEDELLVSFQDFEPMCNVAGMVAFLGQIQLELGAQECRTQFRDQFFHCIDVITPCFRFCAVEAFIMAGPVRQLMQRRGIISFRSGAALTSCKLIARGQPDFVEGGNITRTTTLMLDNCFGVADKPVDIGEGLERLRIINRRVVFRLVAGQLRAIEHPGRFQERDGFDFTVNVFLNGVVVDNQAALLAFTDGFLLGLPLLERRNRR